MVVLSVLTEEVAKEALSRHFEGQGIKFWRRPGKLRHVERFFLPYHFFRVRFITDGQKTERTVALDGLLGEMMFFVSDDLKSVGSMDDEFCPFLVSDDSALERLNDNVRWMRLESSLRQKISSGRREVVRTERVYYPYWVGYFRRRGLLDFKALDAVSGEIQSVRMRRVFLRAFRALQGE